MEYQETETKNPEANFQLILCETQSVEIVEEYRVNIPKLP